MPLNTLQDVTYEVALFFAQFSSYMQSDIIVTVDGHEVFAESREEFAPGPGVVAEYQSKRFEARAGAPRLPSPGHAPEQCCWHTVKR